MVFMPHGLTYELHQNVMKQEYTIAGEWICHQPVPLQYVLFQNMKVLGLHSNIVYNAFNLIFTLQLLRRVAA